MDVPEPTTVRGAYVYLIGGLLLLTFVLGVYVVAAHYGFAPDPVQVTG